MTINLDTTFREAFEEYLSLPSAPSRMLRERRLDFERLDALCDMPFRHVDQGAFARSIQHTWAAGNGGCPYAAGTCRTMRNRLRGFLRWVNRQLEDPGRYTFPALRTPQKKEGEDYLDPDSLRTLLQLVVLGRRSEGWGWMSPVLQMMLAYGVSPEEIAAIKAVDCDVDASTIQFPGGETKAGPGAYLVLKEIEDHLNGRAFAFHDKETAAQGAQKIRDMLMKLHNKKRFKSSEAVALKNKLKYLPRRMAKTVRLAKQDPDRAMDVLSRTSTPPKGPPSSQGKGTRRVSASGLPPRRPSRQDPTE